MSPIRLFTYWRKKI